MTSRKREDQQSGRRETLRLLGAAGVTALVGGGGGQIINLWPAGQPDSSVEAATLPGALRSALFSPSPSPRTKHVSQLTCVVKLALTEGPYFVDELLNRSDIRSDPATGAVRPGVPLQLKFNVYNSTSSTCTALAGALVDIWHCDALGNYSDNSGGMGNANTLGQKFLRGYQVTDANGSASFTTISLRKGTADSSRQGNFASCAARVPSPNSRVCAIMETARNSAANTARA